MVVLVLHFVGLVLRRVRDLAEGTGSPTARFEVNHFAPSTVRRLDVRAVGARVAGKSPISIRRILTDRRAAIAVVVLLAACGGRPAKPAIRPTARFATTAAIVDGVVFVAGGVQRGATGDATVATVEAYDPDARLWTACAPMSTPRAFAASAVFDGKVYVFGGLDAAGKSLDTVEMFDPERGSWIARASMGQPRSRLAVAKHFHQIVVAGGTGVENENLAKVRVYAPKTNTWLEWADLPSPRHGFGLVDADDETDRIFAVGGYDDAGPLARTDVFGVGTVKARGPDGKLRWRGATATDTRTGKVTTFDEDYQGYSWWPGSALAQARGFFGLAAVGRRIYAVGGRCAAVPRTEVLDMDAAAEGWKQAASLPKDLCRFSMVEWDGRLLVFGGETAFGKAVNTDVIEYDPTEDKWSVR